MGVTPHVARRTMVLGLLVGVVVLVGAVGTAALVTTAFDGEDDVEDPLMGPGYYASSAAVCELLGPGDLELALGAAYEEGVAPAGMTFSFAGISGITKCFYSPVSQGIGAVELGVVYAYAEQVLAEHRDKLGDRAVEISGVGERAVWDSQAGELLVLAEDRIVGLSVPSTADRNESDLVERGRRLADTAIERLR